MISLESSRSGGGELSIIGDIIALGGAVGIIMYVKG